PGGRRALCPHDREEAPAMSDTTPGRRSAARPNAAFDATTVLALLVPVLTVVALLLVRPDQPQAVRRDPTRAALTSASIVCPSALPGAPAAYLTTAEDGARGTVRVTTGSGAAEGRVSSGARPPGRPGPRSADRDRRGRAGSGPRRRPLRDPAARRLGLPGAVAGPVVH